MPAPRLSSATLRPPIFRSLQQTLVPERRGKTRRSNCDMSIQRRGPGTALAQPVAPLASKALNIFSLRKNAFWPRRSFIFYVDYARTQLVDALAVVGKRASEKASQPHAASWPDYSAPEKERGGMKLSYTVHYAVRAVAYIAAQS